MRLYLPSLVSSLTGTLSIVAAVWSKTSFALTLLRVTRGTRLRATMRSQNAPRRIVVDHAGNDNDDGPSRISEPDRLSAAPLSSTYVLFISPRPNNLNSSMLASRLSLFLKTSTSILSRPPPSPSAPELEKDEAFRVRLDDGAAEPVALVFRVRSTTLVVLDSKSQVVSEIERQGFSRIQRRAGARLEMRWMAAPGRSLHGSPCLCLVYR